jgi:hypothetical protein
MLTLRNLKKTKAVILAKVLTVVIVLGLPLTEGCRHVGDVYSPKEWRKLFAEAGGWTPLPFPDSKYRTGSIIKVNDNGIRWFGDLESCKFPLDEFEKKSFIPSITFTKNWELGAGTIINFKGITAGPKFSRVSKIHMQVKDHGADAFDLMKFKSWMKHNGNLNTVSGVCMDELSKPDRYLVVEAFRVSKGEYTLFDQNNMEIKIETGMLKDLLQLQSDVKYQVTNNGRLLIENPVYFAVRGAYRVGPDFDTRGEGELEKADAKIEKLFFESTKE